jgi:fructose-bisphosphate aldolase class I
MDEDPERIAARLVADGKGILESRRAYREMLFTTPGAAEFSNGAILYDETIRQKSSDGRT